MTQTQHDVISVLTEDHREVEQVFQELETGGHSAERRRQLVDHVIAELVRHSVAEEQYLYPATRDALPDGDDIADHEVAEHAEAEQTMKELDGLDAADPRFDQLLGELMEQIRHHVEEEESTLFPRLRLACDEARLRQLGEQISKAKEWAPTRPHPGAPDQPPMNKILGPGMGLVDRLRDALSSRQT
jgi:hemerythrin superfamily protein